MTIGIAPPGLATIRRLLDEEPGRCLAAARLRIDADPACAEAHRLAARALRMLGRTSEAEGEELAAIAASVHDPDLQAAAQALAVDDLPAAEPLLRARLKAIPHDVAAIRMFAELAGRIGRFKDAESLLRRAIELAPAFLPARANLATVLHRQNRTAEALEELDRLQARDADNMAHANLRAAALGRIGEFEEALALYEAVLERAPDQPKVWMSYGHVLKTVGRQDESIAAYRRAIALRPMLGEVWWSLANLKTVRFADADIAAMEAALSAPGLAEDDRYHLHFALGKALEDRKDWAASFRHYRDGNAGRRATQDYDAATTTAFVDRSTALFTPAFFEERAGWGDPAPDPIFILGMPRAGSTLIEQILASHFMVEGTMELPDIPALAVRTARGREGQYPGALAELGRDEVAALGAEYLDRTRIQRKTDRPYFIDKLPNNWMHAGFIRLILPNARIIDARRHPLASCFSNFRQHFARGQSFTYDLADVGRYYADYVRLMAHVDAVLPGHVHRVIYEAMVEDSEAQIRALLDWAGLPFEPACLRFWETERAVRTASSEQVRRPINREGLEPWKPYAQWLGPLEAALGAVLTCYPHAPRS